MLGQGNVGDRDALEQAIVDHALGAVAGLLGRLEERDQGSGPLATVIGHELGHASRQDMCMSWPQAWATGTSWPAASWPVAVLA